MSGLAYGPVCPDVWPDTKKHMLPASRGCAILQLAPICNMPMGGFHYSNAIPLLQENSNKDTALTPCAYTCLAGFDGVTKEKTLCCRRLLDDPARPHVAKTVESLYACSSRGISEKNKCKMLAWDHVVLADRKSLMAQIVFWHRDMGVRLKLDDPFRILQHRNHTVNAELMPQTSIIHLARWQPPRTISAGSRCWCHARYQYSTHTHLGAKLAAKRRLIRSCSIVIQSFA